MGGAKNINGAQSCLSGKNKNAWRLRSQRTVGVRLTNAVWWGWVCYLNKKLDQKQKRAKRNTT